MTVLIVDGYNAAHAIPEARSKMRSGLRDARKFIVDLAREFVSSSGYIDDFKVVFDGDGRSSDISDLLSPAGQVFSGPEGADDEMIRTMRELSAAGKKMVVASNDNYVRNNARAYGASIIDVRSLKKRTGYDR